ncbi:MAG: hypothetical protein DI537_08645 [Stutzerimonas stutzeri]|nr:MAG: hypothetical protein DI537_08645 [Stutzerimonas stutzeri]
MIVLSGPLIILSCVAIGVALWLAYTAGHATATGELGGGDLFLFVGMTLCAGGALLLVFAAARLAP